LLKLPGDITLPDRELNINTHQIIDVGFPLLLFTTTSDESKNPRSLFRGVRSLLNKTFETRQKKRDSLNNFIKK